MMKKRRRDNSFTFTGPEVNENAMLTSANEISSHKETNTTEVKAKPSISWYLTVWIVMMVASFLSLTFNSTVFSRVTLSNCDMQQYRTQGSALNIQSHNASSWYFQEWGIISSSGFCPLQHYKIRRGRKGLRYKVYLDCFQWSSDIWSRWDAQNNLQSIDSSGATTFSSTDDSCQNIDDDDDGGVSGGSSSSSSSSSSGSSSSNSSGKTSFRYGALIWRVSSYLTLAFGIVGLFCAHVLKFFSKIPVLKDYLFLIVPLFPLGATLLLVLFLFLWGTDQLDRSALQRNMFPTCTVHIDTAWNGAIIGFCIIALGLLDLIAYIYFIYSHVEANQDHGKSNATTTTMTEQQQHLEQQQPLLSAGICRVRLFHQAHANYVLHLNYTIDYYIDQVIIETTKKKKRK